MIKKQPVRDGVMTNSEVALGLASAETPDIAELKNLTFFNPLKKGWRRMFNKRYPASIVLPTRHRPC
ncbi:MAG: hypothetical protein WCA45_06215 [Thiobacillaceae bacterium]